MSAEQFIQQKAAAAIQAIYNTEVAPGSLQVAVTRKEFEGDYTLVTFPLLKITHQAPDATGNAIGQWLVDNVPEISAFNSVKGFLNLSFSPVYWNESLNTEIERALSTLTDREREIIKSFFGIGCQEMTLEEIGERFGLTRERVRQIKEKAIRRLKSPSRSKLLKSYLG